MKTLRYTVCIFFLSVTNIYSMDVTMVSSKRRSFEKMPSELQIHNWPLELQGKLIKNVFNLIVFEDDRSKKHIDQKKLKKYVLQVPLLLGAQCAQEFYQLQQLCKNEIGGKKFLAQELFGLSRQKKDILICVANRFYLTRCLNGDISLADYKTLMPINNKHVALGLELLIVHHDEVEKTKGFVKTRGLIEPADTPMSRKIIKFVLVQALGMLMLPLLDMRALRDPLYIALVFGFGGMYSFVYISCLLDCFIYFDHMRL